MITFPATDALESRDAPGFSLVETLLVVALLGVLTTLMVPQLLEAGDRSRQRKTLADMRSIALANGLYRTEKGTYAATLDDLDPDYIFLPEGDGWGEPFTYANTSDSYTLTCLGKDAATGPPPPADWYDVPFEPDLVVVDGAFTQAPAPKR